MRSLQPTRGPLALSILLTGVLFAITLGVPSAQGSFPGRNGLLAVTYGFKCAGGGIATLDPRSGRLRMLTHRNCDYDSRWIGRASWSPEGNQLVFQYELPRDIASNAE